MGQKVNVAQRTLYDIRDNNSYTIRKLADGNCWMTENLRLVGSRTLTSADSDVSTNFNLPASSTNGWCTDYLDDSCNSRANVITDSGHPEFGAYYSLFAALAGYTATLDPSSSMRVYNQSVCPKGWKIPQNFNYVNLMNQYSTVAEARAIPFSVINSGRYLATDGFMYDQGGTFYTGTVGRTNNAPSAGIYNYDSVVVMSDNRYSLATNAGVYGYPIRCLNQ